MSASTSITLDVGVEVVKRLIPQRAPLLLVDRIHHFLPGSHPRVSCGFFVGEHEPVFAGHFPRQPLWPGAYTIEGLGQAANLVQALDALARELGGENAAQALRQLHASGEAEALREAGPPRVGMSAAVDIKLLEPIFPRTQLSYDVRRTHAMGNVARFAVEALVEGRPVARGSITGAASDSIPGAASS